MTCATCDQPMEDTVYITDYNLHHHLTCFLTTLDLAEAIPTVAEPFKRFVRDNAVAAIDMVLGT